MSGLILPARFRRQPQYPAPIDKSNPLTSDLAFLYNPSVSDRNLVTGAAHTGQAGAGLAIDTGPFGRSAIAASGTAYRYWDVTFPTGPFTAAIFCVDTQRGVYRLPLHLLDSGGAETGYIRGEPNLINARVRNTANVSANAYKADFSEMSATESSLAALVLTPAQSVDLYVNGVGPGYSETVSGTPRAISRILLCNDSTGGSTWSGQLYLVAIWRRALSVAELREFTENPWQLFKYPRRNWVDLGAASGGATYNDSASDSATATDAATQQLTAPAAAADAAAATDSATNLGVLTRSASDAAAASDSASNALTIAASTTDAASATDSSSSVSAVASAAADAVTATDAATQLAVLPAAVSDSVSAADAASSVATMAAAATDAATATDSATGLRITSAAATDAATATDSASQVNAVNVAATDAISAADAATVQAVLAGIVSDGFSAVDAATLLAGIYNLTAADVLSLLDAALADGGVQYARAPQGAGQDLIYPGGRRPAVISGNRPGNINTARPANRGGRRS